LSNQQVIQTTAGEIQNVLRQRGLVATDPITVTITVDPRSGLLNQARDESRPLVIAAGLSDDDIDAFIKDVRREVAAEDA
jgi:hypothetical protein